MRSPWRSKLVFGLILTLTTSTCLAISVRVARVIDGDTFETDDGEKVRMIGINAPEASDVNGPEATRHLEDLIEGKEVTLVVDEISSNRDRYQRLLRYVEIADADVNLRMIQDGFAFAYLKFKFVRSEEYRAAQETATERHVGMWGDAIAEQAAVEAPESSTLLSPKAWFLVGLVVVLILLLMWSLVRR